MKTLLTLMILFLIYGSTLAQNIATQLGYPEDSRLLIIHADDLGVAHAQNAASLDAMENGCVNSGSIMVPCPWFPEIARLARMNGGDFGLHLTITSEWDYYKWGPVSSKDVVSSLVNEDGYFYSSVDSVRMFADPAEAETELRNQITKAMAFGIDVTHLDTHMGAVAATPEILAAYVNLGREFELPVLLTKSVTQAGITLTEKDVVVDAIYQATPEVFESGMTAFYRNMLNELEPGLNCLLLHVAHDTDETQAMMVNHDGWGAKWRQLDYDFFTSPECASLLAENNIQLVTWREIRDKIIRKE